MKTIILGMGNTLISDDGIGIVTLRYLEKVLSHCKEITFCETSWGGFRIIDLLEGFDYAVVIDSIKTGNKPTGSIYHYKPTDLLPTLRLTSYHDINFITALRLAESINAKVPSDIDIFAIEVEDNRSINETINPTLWNSIKECSQVIADKLFEKNIITFKIPAEEFIGIKSVDELDLLYPEKTADRIETGLINN
ncbi:MAG: hydrogenase maturation protease [Ignavibacteriae bacterium]|nr:MAG: hydrogenase maturation protease [Ignavibacteriota bacterium]